MLKSRESLERHLPLEFEPSDSDVVCGKGKASYTHIGNQTFRTLVEANLPRYILSASRNEKSAVAAELAQVIRQNGGGFVKIDPVTGLWFEVGDLAAKEKVAQTMREMALKNDPEKEARKHEKRVKSRARRLAAKRANEHILARPPEDSTHQASHVHVRSSSASNRSMSSSPEVEFLATVLPSLLYQQPSPASRAWASNRSALSLNNTGMRDIGGAAVAFNEKNSSSADHPYSFAGPEDASMIMSFSAPVPAQASCCSLVPAASSHLTQPCPQIYSLPPSASSLGMMDYSYYASTRTPTSPLSLASYHPSSQRGDWLMNASDTMNVGPVVGIAEEAFYYDNKISDKEPFGDIEDEDFFDKFAGIAQKQETSLNTPQHRKDSQYEERW
jgi:hypothetical protein